MYYHLKRPDNRSSLDKENNIYIFQYVMYNFDVFISVPTMSIENIFLRRSVVLLRIRLISTQNTFREGLINWMNLN